MHHAEFDRLYIPLRSFGFDAAALEALLAKKQEGHTEFRVGSRRYLAYESPRAEPTYLVGLAGAVPKAVQWRDATTVRLELLRPRSFFRSWF